MQSEPTAFHSPIGPFQRICRDQIRSGMGRPRPGWWPWGALTPSHRAALGAAHYRRATDDSGKRRSADRQVNNGFRASAQVVQAPGLSRTEEVA